MLHIRSITGYTHDNHAYARQIALKAFGQKAKDIKQRTSKCSFAQNRRSGKRVSNQHDNDTGSKENENCIVLFQYQLCHNN